MSPRPALALASLLLAFFLFATTRSTLWDRDEPRFAQAAVEMERSGDWLVPHFHGEERLHKPAGITWLMAASVRAFGKHEWSVRLVGPVGSALAALALYLLGRRLFDAETAGAALPILLLSPLAIGVGTVSTTDATLCAATTFAFAAFVGAVGRGWRWTNTLGLAAALAAAQLVKGPVGIAIPLLGITGAWLIGRRDLGLGRGFWRGCALATALSIGAFLAWALPANAATEGRFAAEGLGKHVLGRMAAPLEGHGAAKGFSPFYYLPVLILGFLPWAMHLPGALACAVSTRWTSLRARAVLVGWVATTFVLMSFVATKLPHYIFPLFPALALATAHAVRVASRSELDADEGVVRWMLHGRWLAVPILAAIVVAFAGLAVQAPSVPLRVAAGVAAVLLGVGTGRAVLLHGRRRFAASAAVSGATFAALYAWCAVFVLPVAEELKLAPNLVDALAQRVPADVPVASYKFDEPTLVFYLGAERLERLPDMDALEAWLDGEGRGILVTPRDGLDKWSKRHPERTLAEVTAVQGYNYSKGRWVDLVAFER